LTFFSPYVEINDLGQIQMFHITLECKKKAKFGPVDAVLALFACAVQLNDKIHPVVGTVPV